MIISIDESFSHDLLISSITLVEIMDIVKAYNLPLETLKGHLLPYSLFLVCIQSRSHTLKVWQAISVEQEWPSSGAKGAWDFRGLCEF